MRPASSCSSRYVILRASLLVVILLLLGAVLVTGAPTWAAPVPASAYQTVPPFAERLILPLVSNPPQPTNLTQSPEPEYQPTWAPDGSKLAFVSFRTNSDNKYETSLYVINADGSGLRQLTDGDDAPPLLSPESTGWDIDSPAWSPDGSEIAFVYTACSPCNDHGVWHYRMHLIDADGGNLRQLNTFATNPKWSPDGTKILYESASDYTRPAGSLGIMDVHGVSQRFLVEQASKAEWSPDGTKVAFVCFSCGPNYAEVAVINADGTNLTILSTGYSWDDFPTWSPDSKQIAYAAYQGDRAELRVIDATGENPTTLGSIQWQSLQSLAWLSDGSRLAFLATEPAVQQLRLFEIGRDGHGLKRLFFLPQADGFFLFAWSADRSKLAYAYNDDIYILKAFVQ